MIDTHPMTEEAWRIILNPAHITPRTREEMQSQQKSITIEDMVTNMQRLYRECGKEMREAHLRIPSYDGTGQ